MSYVWDLESLSQETVKRLRRDRYESSEWSPWAECWDVLQLKIPTGAPGAESGNGCKVELQPVTVSLVALGISICSFAVAVLSYRRDRSKVRAWSMITWHNNGPDEGLPVMYVRIANVGRRPIFMLRLVMTDGRDQWGNPLRATALKAEPDMNKLADQIVRTSAHTLAVKLEEGETFEIVFRTGDCIEFVGVHVEPAVYATRLMVEDVTGNLYRVKGAKKCIQQLFDARKAALAAPPSGSKV